MTGARTTIPQPPAEPPSTHEVFEQAATIEGWDADYYHPIALAHYDRAVAWTMRALRARPGDLVLDAGCGPGVHAIRAVKLGMRVKALDLSHAMLAEARRRADAAGVLDRIDFQQADLTSLPFPDASFERIFSWGVVIHIPAAGQALSELARILKPGGRLALHVVNAGAWDHKAEAAARALTGKGSPLETRDLGVGKWYDLHGERLWVWRFDARKLERRMSELGLRRVARRAAEFTEVQWRLKGIPRRFLLRLNSLWFRLGLPAGPACTNLHVFEKAG